MIFNLIRSNKPVDDCEFDLIYPEGIKAISNTHFSPVNVCKMASKYLVESKSTKVMDIGAGVGKFCLIGSAYTEGYFVGIEQRKSLCTLANEVINRYHLKNVEMVNENITNISFQDFDAFYFFNSFQENITIADKIDTEFEVNRDLYMKYSSYVKEELDKMPSGTKLVTYYSFLREIPDSYKLLFTAFDEKLKMWQKV